MNDEWNLDELDAAKLVVHETRFRINNGDEFKPATWIYDQNEPWAVTLHIPGDTDWVFARSLLIQGMHKPDDHLDVQIKFETFTISVFLSSPSGKAVLTFDRPNIESFLDRSYRLVHAGAEHFHFDFDAELAKLGNSD